VHPGFDGEPIDRAVQASLEQPGQDHGGPFGLAAHVEALQADEARVIAGPVGEHGLPQGDELGRRERLLGRDPQVTSLWVHSKNPGPDPERNQGAERIARTTVRSAERRL